MKHVAALLITFALAACSHRAMEEGMPHDGVHPRQHPPGVSGSPSPGTTEIDNGAVRVTRMRIGPREKIPMHEMTPRVVVWLTDIHLRLTFPDGSTSELHRKAGETAWFDAQQHAGENLRDQPIEFIAVVPK